MRNLTCLRLNASKKNEYNIYDIAIFETIYIERKQNRLAFKKHKLVKLDKKKKELCILKTYNTNRSHDNLYYLKSRIYTFRHIACRCTT